MNVKYYLAKFISRIFIAAIGIYRITLSYWLGRQCRFLPTCSEYAITALERFGPWAGLWLALSRFTRCRPGSDYGYDAPPEKLPETACWYKPWRYGKWR